MTGIEGVREAEQFGRQLAKVMRNTLSSGAVCTGSSAQSAFAEVVARCLNIVRMDKQSLDGTGTNCAVHMLQEGPAHAIFLLFVSEHAVRTFRAEAVGSDRMHSGQKHGFRDEPGGVGGDILTNGKFTPRRKNAGLKPSEPPYFKHGERLSSREMEILAQLTEGCTNREIAARLFIATGTVRTHLMHIYKKLQVNSRTKAAAKYLDLFRPASAPRRGKKRAV